MIKFRYNYCRYLWLNEQTSEAIEEITETIAICKRYNSSYRLADLYCLLGNISVGFAEKDRILGFYQVSYQLYKHEEPLNTLNRNRSNKAINIHSLTT